MAEAQFGDVGVAFFMAVQYLVMLERDFSWQAQRLVKFAYIVRARNYVRLHTKCISKARKKPGELAGAR